jgi:hypothetical protein
VAESHGGTVSLEDPEIGTGARFVVTIPREDASGDDRPPEPAVSGRRRDR